MAKRTTQRSLKQDLTGSEAGEHSHQQKQRELVDPFVSSRTRFSPSDYVLVMHDDIPTAPGIFGIIVSADGLLHVSLSYQGGTIYRTYVPSQLMRVW